MIDDLIENIESCLLLNQMGDMTDKLALFYIKKSVGGYKKQVKNHGKEVQKGRKIQTDSNCEES